MHTRGSSTWLHDHTFGQDRRRPGESRTLIVISITAAMMVVEILSGIVFGSLALLADGLHMASHASALGIALFAYIYARRHARDRRYSFGVGKMNALGGFTGAVLLVAFALIMGVESIRRLRSPIGIAFDQAIAIAILGLVVNGVCALILGHRHAEDESHHHDHNLRSAYLHVLADALTSVLAIFALLAGKYFGLVWMDPVMGIVGALLIARWSVGLLHGTSGVLLDRQAPEPVQSAIRTALERNSDIRVADLHVWSVGPNAWSVIVSLVSCQPHPPDYYKQLFPNDIRLVHRTVEVYGCPEHQTAPAG